MRVVIINKSDARGGAAVVSMRLLQALNEAGVQTDMLVAEKLTDSEHVHQLKGVRVPFLRERLGIYLANGRNRADLFKVDTAAYGLPLHRHPLVREADIVCLGWVNQGLLSLREIGRIARLKPTVWTMHDMWCATGICHHAGICTRFRQECGLCPFLHGRRSEHDLSWRVHGRKARLYGDAPLHFVAVSRWLKERCEASSLMRAADVRVIGNPFPMPEFTQTERPQGPVEMLMVAARLDDPIKGFPMLKESLRLWRQNGGEGHITLVGEMRDISLLDDFPIQFTHTGPLPARRLPELYRGAHVLLSPSGYETLPGTLVEAQVYGAVPVAFDSGGQRDIVDDGRTGILVDIAQGAQGFADGIDRAVELLRAGNSAELARRMYQSVQEKFSAEAIAHKYIQLFNSLL